MQYNMIIKIIYKMKYFSMLLPVNIPSKNILLHQTLTKLYIYIHKYRTSLAMSSKHISAPEPSSIPITKKSTIAIVLYVSTLKL